MSTAEPGGTAWSRSWRRALELPAGEPGDPPGEATSWALANRKNDLFLAALDERGVRSFPTTLDLVRRRRAHGVRTAVVTASRNAESILAAAGVEALFDVVVDGKDIERLGIPGKPDPSTFVEAAHRLHLEPDRCVIVEDAFAGVEAGRRGGFGPRGGKSTVSGQADALRGAGADVVVADLADSTRWAVDPALPGPADQRAGRSQRAPAGHGAEPWSGGAGRTPRGGLRPGARIHAPASPAPSHGAPRESPRPVLSVAGETLT